ncbi:hypothetical protein GCM10029964_032670 [Kibdelosporangium lantanae]
MSTAGVPSRPRTLGIGLACCAAAIIVNVLIQLLSLVLSRAESSLWTSLLLGVVLAAALLLLTYRGYGLAYVALGGVIAYALIVRVIDVVVTTPTLTQSDISPEGMVVVWALTLLGYAQLVLLVLGAALAFGPGARMFVHNVEKARRARLNTVPEPAMVSRVAVPLYLAAGAVLAIELVILVLDALPDSRTPFARWAVRSDFRDFVSWLALLCMTPTLVVLVNRFRAGWLWARTVLTAGAALIGLVDILVVVDGSLPLGSQFAAVFVVLLCAVLLVVTHVNPVNRYFRLVRRAPAGPAGPSSAPGPSGPFAPPGPS